MMENYKIYYICGKDMLYLLSIYISKKYMRNTSFFIQNNHIRKVGYGYSVQFCPKLGFPEEIRKKKNTY